ARHHRQRHHHARRRHRRASHRGQPAWPGARPVTAGFALVESLVALLVTAIALAALSAGATAGVRFVRQARERSAAVELAAGRLDALRAGPRDAGSDEVVVAGVTYTRTWSSDGGRGAPAHLEVGVTWTNGHVALDSEAFP